MSYEISGTIKVIEQKQTFSSGFEKQEFVITTQEQYPQDIKFELVKDKISAIGKFKVGDAIKVSFNIRGNEYQGKYYVNLSAWKLEDGKSSASAPSGASAKSAAPSSDGWPTLEPADQADDTDDLPF